MSEALFKISKRILEVRSEARACKPCFVFLVRQQIRRIFGSMTVAIKTRQDIRRYLEDTVKIEIDRKFYLYLYPLYFIFSYDFLL
jgi:hypothetical protein